MDYFCCIANHEDIIEIASKHNLRIIHDAAAATVPTPVLDVLGIRRKPGAVLRGRLLIRALRAALGASPAWAAALERCGEPRPPGVRFRNAPDTSR